MVQVEPGSLIVTVPDEPLLAAIELATAIFGIISLGAFEQIGALIVDWPLPAVAAVNLSLVLVPTLLMGATLPILVSHLVRRSGEVGGTVGLLYYVNTMGAGAACLLCSALLFPFLGMQHAVFVAVGMNVAVSAWFPAPSTVPAAGAYTKLPGTLAVAFSCVPLSAVP